MSTTPSKIDWHHGLDQAQVAASRERYGSNVLTPPARKPWWREFLLKFTDPLIIILLVAGALSLGIAFYEYSYANLGWKVFFDPVGIFIAIFLATGLAYLFEAKANKAFRILNQVNDDEPVEVVRGGSSTTVPRRDVVVGDIVIVNTGDEIPADGDLLDAVNLSVDESTLTGEPLCAKTTDPAHFDPDATYPSNHLLRGTKAMEGHGVMVVTRIGDATEMGKVYKESLIDDSVKTPLNEQLDRLARLISELSYSIAGLVVLSLIIGFLGWGAWQSWLLVLPVVGFFGVIERVFPKWNKLRCGVAIVIFFAIFIAAVAGIFAWLNPDATSSTWTLLIAHTLKTLMVAVTLIVVAVPEGLPMAVTLSLAYSMRRMLRTNNLVRKMHACETMGAATVICTDKTGTLTQNRMKVAEAHVFGGVDPDIVDEGISVNSTATLDFTADDPRVLGNPTEGALLLWLHGRGIDFAALKDRAERVAELPFTTERKYMATLVKSGVNGRLMLYVKGAPEIAMGLCSSIAGGTSSDEVNRQLLEYQRRGMRTLGLACCEVPSADGVIADNGIKAPQLQMIGVIAISDPVRDDVPAAVSECRTAGIDVKIVTGDTPATAREIARQVGVWTDIDTDDNIITGPEFAALTDDELDDKVLDLKIIARARPSDKRRLVERLQAKGQVVAVTGDGTNDAPALKAAHVGLSMGDGTSVAKEASDITIIDNSFSSIGRAVMWGRSLYQNIQRFLLFQLTVNVAACLLVLVGSLIGTESPLSVTQMLWVNLIMDTFGAMALASLPPSPAVMHNPPRDRRASILTRPMITELVSVGVLFFIITLGFYLLFTYADVTSLPSMFHAEIGDTRHTMTPYEATLLFSIFVWTHFWYMFDTRVYATGQSIFRLKMSGGFWTIVWIIVVGQIFITEIAYEFFNVAPMFHTLDWHFNPTGTLDFIIIVAASSLVLWLRELYRLLRPN